MGTEPDLTSQIAEALDELGRFPLVEAIYGRRARRFSLGGRDPGRAAGLASRHEPVPLSELEQMLVLTAARATPAGTT